MAHRMTKVVVLSLLTAALLAPAVVHANDADVLPEGVFKVGQSVSYDWATDQFKPVFGAGTWPVTKWYNITVYLSDLSPDAAKQLDRFCTGKRCVVGTTEFDLLESAMKLNTNLMYGITDRLSAGFIVPYVYALGDSSLEVTGSNMGIHYKDKEKNIIDPKQPIAPYSSSFPGVKRPINKDDVVTILSDPAFGFEYVDPLGLHQGWYLGDIIFGGRYLIYEKDWWKTAVTLFFITPTGQQKNYNYLFDPANGDGQLDVGFWSNNDFIVSKKRHLAFTLNFTTGYTTQFPQTKHFRVGSISRTAWNEDAQTYDPDDKVENPLPIGSKASSLLDLRRDIGDNLDFYGGFKWEITPWLILSQEFYYYYKWRDMFEVVYNPMNCELVSQYDHDNRDAKYCNEPGADHNLASIQTHQLSLQTDREELLSTTTLTFSTLPFVESGKFPVPFFLTAGYKRSLAGKNIEQANAVFMNLDLIGSIYMFDEDFEKRMEEQKKQSAMGGGIGMNHSLANQAMTK